MRNHRLDTSLDSKIWSWGHLSKSPPACPFPRKSRAFSRLGHLLRVCSLVAIDSLFQIQFGEGLLVIIKIIRRQSDDSYIAPHS